MKHSRTRVTSERFTGAQARHRAAQKATKADQAFWVEVGGQVAWRAELDRRRRARNERTRERTSEAVAEKRRAQQLSFADEMHSA